MNGSSKEFIDSIIDKTMDNILNPTIPDTPKPTYTNKTEYKEQTGKRFRMTRDQKQRGLNSDEAFQEHLESLNK